MKVKHEFKCPRCGDKNAVEGEANNYKVTFTLVCQKCGTEFDLIIDGNKKAETKLKNLIKLK